ncbi:MAG: methylmalonyl Co-A mutase-associated GTPase MeaB [Anaerolineaceae bacterium]|nr:methylmalonyl Co-A mutase-associated GTPase MeaB [Anaerolineaceae bacterium]
MRGTVDVQGVLAGERRALARALTEVENDSPAGRDALDALFRYSGQAHLVGVTGSPGAGKSSLVNQMTRLIRNPSHGESKKVAIVAVDPSSPFTGGAILGDRIRMRDIVNDDGVFIRSMASRGHLGGIARTTSALVRVLDAAGFDLILIETVGAGQSEVDIARLAHTTVVVEAPGMGDDIQAIKAGILEIADILVVNKADHPLADNTMRALSASLEFSRPGQVSSIERFHHRELAFEPVKSEMIKENDRHEHWIPPVLKTVSTEGVGIEEVVASVENHGKFLRDQGQWQFRDAARLQEELNELLIAAFASEWRRKVDQSKIESVLKEMLERKLSPQNAAIKLLSP